MHTTNYYDTFIEVAGDCPAEAGQEPPSGESPTIAALHYELIAAEPYALTSDEVIFETHARRAGVPDDERPAVHDEFFSKGRPCLRSSPLGTRYGWGIHSDAAGRVAAYPVESDDYRRLSADPGVTHLRALRSRRG